MRATLMICLLLSERAFGDQLSNGNFEHPIAPLTSHIILVSPGSEPSGFSWTVVSGTVEIIAQNYAYGSQHYTGPAVDGNQWLDLDGLSAGSLSQNFRTAPGISYPLRFFYANNAVWPAAQARVSVRDTVTGADLILPLTISHGNSSLSDYQWTDSGDIEFTAQGYGTTVLFDSLSPASSRGGIFLDAVRVGARGHLGFDISSSAGVVDQAQWNEARAQGFDFVCIQAWDGRTRNRLAERQLRAARIAGLSTSAYCVLNFDDGATTGTPPAHQSGVWQVGQALDAIGSEGSVLSFVALDVEETFPLRLNPLSRIRRISEAVVALESLGIKSCICTSRSSWAVIALDTPIYAQFGIPLWDARNDDDPDLDTDYGVQWRPYGGWNRRLGKRYEQSTREFGIPVNLDGFDASLFR